MLSDLTTQLNEALGELRPGAYTPARRRASRRRLISLFAVVNGKGCRDTRPRGSALGNAKLTEKDIPIIRAMGASGATQHAIAARFNVSQTLVSDILNRKIWKHV